MQSLRRDGMALLYEAAEGDGGTTMMGGETVMMQKAREPRSEDKKVVF